MEASAHTSPVTYMGRDGRQYVVVMAAGGGGFLGGGSSNTLVAFARPGVTRKALPATVSRAVALAATARKSEPKLGLFAPVALPEGGARTLVQRTCGVGCHSLEVVTTQRRGETEWRELVQNMVARGADVKDAEVPLIVRYLQETLGKN